MSLCVAETTDYCLLCMKNKEREQYKKILGDKYFLFKTFSLSYLTLDILAVKYLGTGVK